MLAHGARSADWLCMEARKEAEFLATDRSAVGPPPPLRKKLLSEKSIFASAVTQRVHGD